MNWEGLVVVGQLLLVFLSLSVVCLQTHEMCHFSHGCEERDKEVNKYSEISSEMGPWKNDEMIRFRVDPSARYTVDKATRKSEHFG